jgi:curved DNA-binding protein CbpA
MIEKQHTDYYRILEIDRQATPEEIKHAFRRQAKRYHPDKNPGQEQFAERMFRRICVAYETLRDDEQKFRYDLTLKSVQYGQEMENAYLERLRRTRQTRYKYELMFRELLSQNYEAGIQIYEQLQRNADKFCIDDFLNYTDSRDCEFLIAEAYQNFGNYRSAMRIYESLLLYEKRRPVFRHFIDEIKDRLKQIYFHNLTRPQNLEDIPTNLEKIRALELSKQETAWIYKKLAEFYFEFNWLSKAKEMLRSAFELHPRMAGAKKICQKLGMEYLLAQVRHRQS